VHSGELEVELEEARKKLAATPESAPMVRKLLQQKVQKLENEILATGGGEPLKSGEPKESTHNGETQTDPGTLYRPKNRFNLQPMTLGEYAAQNMLNQAAETIAKGPGFAPGDAGVQVEPEAADCDVAPGRPAVATLENERGSTRSSYRSVLDAKLCNEARNYVLDSIKCSEEKAMFFLALLTANLAFLITHSHMHWLAEGAQWSVEDSLGFLSVLGLAVAAGLMLAVLYVGRKDSDRGLRFLNAMTEPNRPVDHANGLVAEAHDRLTEVLQEDFIELSTRYEAASRVLRYGFWVGSIAAFISLLVLLSPRTQHIQLSAPPF